MNRFLISIIIVLIVFQQKSIIIKSETIHHTYPLSSSSSHQQQQQQQPQIQPQQQQQQQQQHDLHNQLHHRLRHQNHHNHHNQQHQQQHYNHHNNPNLISSTNINNNLNNRILTNNLRTKFDLINNQNINNKNNKNPPNNYNISDINDDDDDDEEQQKQQQQQQQQQQQNLHDDNDMNMNSMEFIGFDDDPMKNFNSEYSINTDSKELYSSIVKNNDEHLNYNNQQDQNLHNHQQQYENSHNHNYQINSNDISHQIIPSNDDDDDINHHNEFRNGDISIKNTRNSIINNINPRISSDNSDIDTSSSSSSSNSIKCPKCSGSTNVQHVSEEELIKLRIEFVKNQILQKLRLKEKPKVPKNGLPKLIYEGTQIGIQNDENKSSKDLDDYYARTSQKFIFLEQEKKECYRTNHQQHPSMCFSFKIDGDVDNLDVNTAELWVYKRQSPKDKMKQTFVVSELYQGTNSNYLPKAKTIAIQSTGVEAGWIKFDIAWPIRKWFGNHDLNHIIEVSCQSCEPIDDIVDGGGVNDDNTNNNNNNNNNQYYKNKNTNYYDNKNLISADKDYTPFIVIDTMNRRQRRRQKRNVNCTAGVTECCREKLYISFEEIGWDDWIIQPSGYNAYFCRGSCSSAASITMSNTHHSSFLRKVLYQRESNGKKPLELIPCCTAKQYSSLQLFYRDSNNTATLKTLPNMVVESCGCM